MKLLLDQGLPRSAADSLRQLGIDAIHVGEIGYSSAEDAEILKKARKEGRTIITLDAGFHTLLAFSGATFPSVVRIRMEGVYGDKAVALIQMIFKYCHDDIENGAMVTVQSGRIRVRRLPII